MSVDDKPSSLHARAVADAVETFKTEHKQLTESDLDTQLIIADAPGNILKVDRDKWTADDINALANVIDKMSDPRTVSAIWSPWQLVSTYISAFGTAELKKNGWRHINALVLMNTNLHTAMKSSSLRSSYHVWLIFARSPSGFHLYADQLTGDAATRRYWDGQLVSFSLGRERLMDDKKKVVREEQKSVDEMERLVTLFSTKGARGLVVDLFAGTGTTAIAALKCGRLSISFDNDDQCIHYARLRIQEYCKDNGLSEVDGSRLGQ